MSLFHSNIIQNHDSLSYSYPKFYSNPVLSQTPYGLTEQVNEWQQTARIV